MTTTASLEVRSVSPEHTLDEIDEAADLAARQYCDRNRQQILDNPVKELTGLFDQLTENYSQRQLHYRVDYGDEVTHVMHYATRTPDRSRIDEVFSEFVVYQNLPSQKLPQETAQRNITILSETGDSFQRLIFEGGELLVVDQNGQTIDPSMTDEVIIDAVRRAHKAVGTYNDRPFIVQTQADWDALAKLQDLKLIIG